MPGFVTYSRRFVLPSQVPPALQPCLILREPQMAETSQYQGQLEKRLMKAWIYGYARVPKDSTAPGESLKLAAGATIINPLMDAIEDTLEPPPGVPEQYLPDAQGKPQVAYVRYGDTIKETGDTDPEGQAFFVMELEILVP